MDDREIIIPSSKSYAQRFIICASLCCKENQIICLHNVNICNDVKSCINAMRILGANIHYKENGTVEITRGIDINHKIDNHINIGESGTTCRILIPILASFEQYYTITGNGSILNRDMSSCKDIFDINPVYYKLNNNKLPIKLFGSLNCELYNLDGSLTSQYISGLIIAYAYHNKNCHIKIKNCDSYGYIKITLDVLNQFGITNIKVNKCNNKLIDLEIYHDPEIEMYSNNDIFVELDWSSFGAMYFALSTIGNEEETISNIGVNLSSVQPDYDILYEGKKLFKNIKVNEDKSISIKHIDYVDPFKIDISKTPDLFPYYAGFATLSDSYCEISGLNKLVNKESNRGQVIFEEFTKLGIDCKIVDNSIFIKKGKDFFDKRYNSHNDHRIGQTLAIIKLIHNGHIKQYDECINKSYPKFINDIEKIYAKHIRRFI